MRSNLLTLILICVSVIANAQKKQEVLDFIENFLTLNMVFAHIGVDGLTNINLSYMDIHTVTKTL